METQTVIDSISAEVRLRHLALVTHAVPAERVRRRLPPGFDLETFNGTDGKEKTLVTTSCFLNEDLRWSLLPQLSASFHQLTFRTYVRYGDRVGAYFFGTDVGSGPGYLLQRSIAKNVAWARMAVRVSRTEAGYRRYHCHSRSNHGVTEFRLTAGHKPIGDEQKKLAQRLSYRLHGFFESYAGVQADQYVEHKRMSPYAGELLSGRFEFWERLGILERGEGVQAHSVLVQPVVRFRVFPAVPIRLLPKPGFTGFERRAA